MHPLCITTDRHKFRALVGPGLRRDGPTRVVMWAAHQMMEMPCRWEVVGMADAAVHCTPAVHPGPYRVRAGTNSWDQRAFQTVQAIHIASATNGERQSQ